MNIVLTRRLPGSSVGKLAQYYTVRTVDKGRPLNSGEITEELSRADVAICTLTDKIGKEQISSQLKCLITFSVGLEHLDLPTLIHRGIRVSHTPVVLTAATADLTWALLLACARRLTEGSSHVQAGEFNGFGPELFLGMPLEGAVLGIIGMGRIGQAVALRGKGFGLREVLYSSPRRLEPAVEKELCARSVELEELLRNSDFVSIHCPHRPETRYLIGASELRQMKDRACLINTARGPIIDEEALAAHLRQKPHFVCGLDVYEEEPTIHPGLLGRRNAICLPHMGSANLPSREAMARVCIEEAIRFAKGDRLLYELDEKGGVAQ